MATATKNRYSDDTAAEAPTAEENDGPSYKFLRFYSQKANVAVNVIATIGTKVKDGHPFLTEKVPTGETEDDGEGGTKPVYETKITDVKDAPFIVLQELQYWSAKPNEAPYDPIGNWLTKQSFKAKFKGTKVKGAYVAQILLLTDSGPVLALAEVIGTKAMFMDKAVKALAESKTKEFVKANPDLRKVPARFRQVGRFNIIPKTGKFGPWSYADAVYDAISSEQLAAVNAWLDSAEEEQDTFQELFDAKDKAVRDLADKTPPIGD
jgi:hypothetical protein